jgi:hypothetical protein
MEAMRIYFQKDIRRAFVKYCKDKDIPRGSLINDLLRQHLHREGCI